MEFDNPRWEIEDYMVAMLAINFGRGLFASALFFSSAPWFQNSLGSKIQE
jgi:hypothetical protein